MIITSEMLRAKGACSGQLKLFTRLCPNGSPATREGALAFALEHAGSFDWAWAAKHLLPPSALAAYDKATAPALASYDNARASAQAAYDKATASAFIGALFA